MARRSLKYTSQKSRETVVPTIASRASSQSLFVSMDEILCLGFSYDGFDDYFCPFEFYVIHILNQISFSDFVAELHDNIKFIAAGYSVNRKCGYSLGFFSFRLRLFGSLYFVFRAFGSLYFHFARNSRLLFLRVLYFFLKPCKLFRLTLLKFCLFLLPFFFVSSLLFRQFSRTFFVCLSFLNFLDFYGPLNSRFLLAGQHTGT